MQANLQAIQAHGNTTAAGTTTNQNQVITLLLSSTSHATNTANQQGNSYCLPTKIGTGNNTICECNLHKAITTTPRFTSPIHAKGMAKHNGHYIGKDIETLDKAIQAKPRIYNNQMPIAPKSCVIIKYKQHNEQLQGRHQKQGMNNKPTPLCQLSVPPDIVSICCHACTQLQQASTRWSGPTKLSNGCNYGSV